MKNTTLEWFGDCLRSNADRGKLWNVHTPALNPSSYMTVNDGFMINLMTVLLHFSQPFSSDIKNNKILKVDPTYCAVPVSKEYFYNNTNLFIFLVSRMKSVSKKEYTF